MKLGYKTEALEYIGEYNFIINNPIYTIYNGIRLEENKKRIKSLFILLWIWSKLCRKLIMSFRKLY